MLGVIPSGVLIAGGCAVYIYTRIKYEPPAPAFENFAKLKQHLLSKPSTKQRGNVVVEGTVGLGELTHSSDQDQPESADGAPTADLTSTSGDKYSLVCDTSAVAFLIVDSKGESITVRFSDVRSVVKKLKKEPTVLSDSQAVVDMTLPAMGARLGLFGKAWIEDNQVVLAPREVDVSLSAIVVNRKSQKLKLYACSCLLILGGGALFVVSFVMPVLRVYKLLRTLLALIGNLI